MEKMEEKMEVKAGDLVWAKLEHSPWWPAQVVPIEHAHIINATDAEEQLHEDEILQEYLKSDNVFDHPHLVYFFGDGTYDFVQAKNLRGLDGKDIDTMRDSKEIRELDADLRRDYKMATSEVKELLRRRRGIAKNNRFDIIDVLKQMKKLGANVPEKVKPTSEKEYIPVAAPAPKKPVYNQDLITLKEIAASPLVENGSSANPAMNNIKDKIGGSKLWNVYNNQLRKNEKVIGYVFEPIQNNVKKRKVEENKMPLEKPAKHMKADNLLRALDPPTGGSRDKQNSSQKKAPQPSKMNMLLAPKPKGKVQPAPASQRDLNKCCSISVTFLDAFFPSEIAIKNNVSKYGKIVEIVRQINERTCTIKYEDARCAYDFYINIKESGAFSCSADRLKIFLIADDMKKLQKIDCRTPLEPGPSRKKDTKKKVNAPISEIKSTSLKVANSNSMESFKKVLIKYLNEKPGKKANHNDVGMKNMVRPQNAKGEPMKLKAILESNRHLFKLNNLMGGYEVELTEFAVNQENVKDPQPTQSNRTEPASHPKAWENVKAKMLVHQNKCDALKDMLVLQQANIPIDEELVQRLSRIVNSRKGKALPPTADTLVDLTLSLTREVEFIKPV